ncbi:ComF family protein [Telmatospirillum siberiense]|uniref:Amidophosphoribosyltransferase n=1 Tax=Telmatospirillum siberiense TaxID=382514 RepID=A0A2N3Q1X4_9PROT|nr:ComF family protein [Telmatospirillum siberiense]PKU26654.1 amidophosphoribosyltransferase [Telmatospirillum siberiense]
MEIDRACSVLFAAFRRWAGVVIDVLIPPRCLSCGGVTEAQGTLCPSCWEGITFLGPPFCLRCGLPFEVDTGGAMICARCLSDPPRYRRARAVFRYDGASKGLVLGLKHADRVGRAPYFARWMARAGMELLAEADLIVPVPLHRWRLFQRRYNQSALLANGLSKLSGVPCRPDALIRVRHTPKQGSMGRRQRRANLHGAIHLNRHAEVKGRHVLLIDDVLTSGATVEECVRVLRGGGAAVVDVLTLARVVRPGD